MRAVVLTGLLFALAVRADARPDDPEPPSSVRAAVGEGIRLLEKKEYRRFLEKFVSPDDMQKILRRLTIEQFADEFGRGKAADMLEVLKHVRNKKPTLDKDGKKATFQIEIKGAPRDQIRFIKIGRRWCIQN
jgi:hypothetical protein